MDECENDMHHNGERTNSKGLVILVESLDVFTLGLLLPAEERPLLYVLYCFSCWPHYDVTGKGGTNVRKDSLFTLAVPDSAVLQTQPLKEAKNLCLLRNSKIHCYTKQKPFFFTIYIVVL